MKLSEREISGQMMVSKTAVHNAIKNFKTKVLEDSKRLCCPRISSIRDDRAMAKIPRWSKSIDNLRLFVFSQTLIPFSAIPASIF